MMRAGGGQRAAMALIVSLRRRQPQRLLGELGCDRRRATVGRESRSVIEHSGDSGVRRILRQREMTGAKERIIDDLRDPP